MTGRIILTIACDDFDTVRAMIDGTVKPDGIDLVFTTELSNPERHSRMVRDLAFDVCELNVSTYLIAKERGVAITAMPIFLFRKFRHGNVFINTQSAIKTPQDLIGQRIGCPNLQPASNVWLNGILQDDFGVPHRRQTWVVERDEDAAFTPPPDLRIERTPPGRTAVSMLLDGELAAAMTPQTPQALLDRDPRIVRLFPDYVQRERAFFERTGIFPIMHVTVIKQEIVDRYPWVPRALRRAFDEAKQVAYKRMANVRVIPLPWFGAHWEDERALFGPDPWTYGLTDLNRKNLATVIRYTHEQGLTSKAAPIDELFVQESQDV
jgi:4,5-dihydroxyphthalate decarboxylase